MNKYLNRIPAECRAVFQEWVGEKIRLDNIVLYAHAGEDAIIVVAFIGYSVNFYRLVFTMTNGWVISVDESIHIDELQKSIEETYSNYEEAE